MRWLVFSIRMEVAGNLPVPVSWMVAEDGDPCLYRRPLALTHYTWLHPNKFNYPPPRREEQRRGEMSFLTEEFSSSDEGC